MVSKMPITRDLLTSRMNASSKCPWATASIMWSEALSSAGNLGSAALLHDWSSPIFRLPQAEGKPLSVYGSLIKVALSKMAAKRSRQHKLNADCFWKEAHANRIRHISLIIQKLTATLKHVCISDQMTFFAELLTQSGSRKSEPGWLLAITWRRLQWELQVYIEHFCYHI